MSTSSLSPNAPKTTAAAKILTWRPYQKNSLQAFFSVQLPSGLIIADCTYHVDTDGNRWISMPARPYEDDKGKKGWSPIVSFADRPSRHKLQDLVLEAIDRHLAAGGGQ